jgi:hypothetical protein|tara:strand:- start:23488 stop:24150 length:663 start_codon:yes stop_codon:yes gene_type:complete
MEDDEKPSAWAMLGRSAGMGQQEIEELKARVEELERKILMMQGETLGSIEALQRRVHQLENSKTSESVLDVIPVEELNEIAGTKIGVWPEKDDYVDDEEVVKVVSSGFTYNADDTQEEEPEVVEEEYDASTDGPDSVTHKDCALAIVDYISDNGGVANADWKKKSLVPDTYEYEDRKMVREILESMEGITYWKRNNMWWFWYNEEEGLDAAHTRAYGSPP